MNENLKESIRDTEVKIANILDEFRQNTGFSITAIDINIIETGLRCGPVYVLGKVEITIKP